MNRILLALAALTLAAACDRPLFGGLFGRDTATPPKQIALRPGARPTGTAPVLGERTTAAALDTTSAAEREAATAPISGGQLLGEVTVALGPPADPGFWLSGPLVTTPGKGRVTTASGQSVAVDLRPSTTGALLSFAAFRALGLSLTDLPNVSVFRD